MSKLNYDEIVQVLGGKVKGKGFFAGCISIDTRSMSKGDLFVALKGEHFDGHQFVEVAVELGASAIMVEHEFDVDVTQIIVPNARLALGCLAMLWRKQFDIPIVAITGSNGKTTVKEMVASILSLQGRTLATKGNLNNDVGVPLTLLRLRDAHEYAVIELGANHAGEIKHLVQLTLPTTAVITNAAAAHLEGFGDIDGVANAKAEIYSGLDKNGIAIINADDHYSDLWHEYAMQFKMLRFTLQQDKEAEITGCYASGEALEIIVDHKSCQIDLKLPGKHNASNALAAAAVAVSVGISLQGIRDGLEQFHSIAGRLNQRRGICGINVWDDTYNANPASLKAALDILVTYPGELWLILGDMYELGTCSHSLHYDMGEYAREVGVTHLYALGDLAAFAVRGFGEGAELFTDYSDLVSNVKANAGEGINILVKGSRAMHMESVVAELLVDNEDVAQPHVRG